MALSFTNHCQCESPSQAAAINISILVTWNYANKEYIKNEGHRTSTNMAVRTLKTFCVLYSCFVKNVQYLAKRDVNCISGIKYVFHIIQ